MPWARLHATKDYYDMAALLDSHPNIRMTFNLVPSLLVQLEDFARGTGTDDWLEKTLLPANKLSKDDKIFILKNFFYCNWENMIFSNPRFAELFEKRGRFATRDKISRAAANFSDQDFLDLQVWFNLAWMDPHWRETDPKIAELYKKGKGFREEDKIYIVQKQKEICGAVSAKHKELWEKGQIEVSTTPFYHPILPLLCDTDIAQMSMPDSQKPRKPFHHPEDARHQIERSIKYIESAFGRKPKGFWPSEGSVSQEAAALLAQAGLSWIATDEGVLFKSLERENAPFERSDLYQPYWIETPQGEKIQAIFRDHSLSDSIGFVYSRMEAREAAEDFIRRIEKIADALPERETPPILSIILDGENCWEYFKNDGRDFLNHLYRGLASHPGIETTTVSSFLEKYPPKKTLKSLWAGSWINNDFAIWIGHPEDNRAWDLLHEAREFLAETSKNRDKNDPALISAWESLYIAEGSDWCWWFGDQNSTAQDGVFDLLFRTHLKNIYQFMGAVPPQKLDMAVKSKERKGLEVEPSALISPRIDGLVTNYYEWRLAGVIHASFAGGTMHQAENLLASIHYGFDLNNLYLRFDTKKPLKDLALKSVKFRIDFIEPAEHQLEIFWDEQESPRMIYANPAGELRETNSIGAKKVVELSIPFNDLGTAVDGPVEFTVSALWDNLQIERWPYQSSIRFKRPKEDFGQDLWNA